MSVTTPPTLTAPPATPPNSNDPANFDPRADSLLGWLPTLISDMTAALANVFANATDAYNSAVAALGYKNGADSAAAAASSSAIAAATSAGAAMWSSGTYSAGTAARSPSNLRVYIARTTGSKPTDPALDPTNWGIATAGGLPDVPHTGTTASVSLGERSRFTNSAAVAATVPAPTNSDEEWAGLWENGLYTNSFDIGAATLRHNNQALTGVITNNLRLPIHLVSVGANEWRLAA